MITKEEIQKTKSYALMWKLLIVAFLVIMIIVMIKTMQQGNRLTGKDRRGIDVPYH